jgi:dTMP kinase
MVNLECSWPESMSGLFITFEGNEGSGKSTQIVLLAERLHRMGKQVQALREPGGTAIGEEIRHTLKHSQANHAMTPEAELLLMNASRAQLVREVIRPAITAGKIVLCDRFYDSTTAYQGHGRQLDLAKVRAVIDIAVGDMRPHLTLFLDVPVDVSEARRQERQGRLFPNRGGGVMERVPLEFDAPVRDRFEESDRAFFERVEQGYRAVAIAEPHRVKVVDATKSVEQVAAAIWQQVAPLIGRHA